MEATKLRGQLPDDTELENQLKQDSVDLLGMTDNDWEDDEPIRIADP